MKRRIAAAAAAVIALGGGLFLVPRDTPKGCGAGLCCWRPAGAPVTSCLRRNPHTDVAEDIGHETTMPATHAVGVGCVATPCSIVAGDTVDVLR